jgi:hypothetical protein
LGRGWYVDVGSAVGVVVEVGKDVGARVAVAVGELVCVGKGVTSGVAVFTAVAVTVILISWGCPQFVQRPTIKINKIAATKEILGFAMRVIFPSLGPGYLKCCL